MKNIKGFYLIFATSLLFFSSSFIALAQDQESPRIINIINFIRQTDYRLENADSLLFDAVEHQLALSNRYNFPTTFLFQYDALINPKYQELMKNQLSEDSELGAWWEITQPHVEAAGIKWRGEHRWVSTANVAFTPGYTPAERKKLVDVYMAKFKEIYGSYPKSVGSWFIDAYTLQYMHDEYGIVASTNCKDQVGTDGYTLWGGYWNQGYYPSKENAYMPAQTEGNQIPVPIFRMLGSDPMYQYDTGIGTQYQSVISLEPVYPESGKNRNWVEYFLETIVKRPSLAFNYAQAGQENSFTWSEMSEGLEMQFPLFDSLRAAGEIRVETLEETGSWFKDQFPLTPATAITTLRDVREEGNKSVWYNSRFYRSNLFWEENSFCFRDIHLFDENLQSQYLETPGTGNQFFYYTLPFIDRFHWSTEEESVGLRLIALDSEGKSKEIVLKDPKVTEPTPTTLRVVSTSQGDGDFIIEFHEDHIAVTGGEPDTKWALELKVPEDRIDRLPFQNFTPSTVQARFADHNYEITCSEGNVVQDDLDNYVFRLAPSEANKLVIDCSVR